MPSSNKTPTLLLNSWIGSDIPKMEDFNADNQLTDQAVSQLQERVEELEKHGGGGGGQDPRLDAHLKDEEVHLTTADREILATCLPVAGTFTGDGNPFQSIILGYRPRFGFVYAKDKPVTTMNASGNAQFSHLGILSRSGCTSGVEISSTGFKATQLGSANQSGQTSIGLNQSGQVYTYLIWK